MERLVRRDCVFGLLLLAATLLAYQPAWHGQPIWDDDRHLTAPQLRSLDGLEHIWFQPGATEQYYPLVHTVFWVEHRLWGDATFGYHIINIILHVLGGFLLMKVLQDLQIPGAHLAAAAFVLHPVQVESVAWMTELKNTLSGVFYFGAALAYLRFDRTREKGTYAAALAMFTLGMLSKTAILTFPAALLVIFWWKRGKLSRKSDVVPLLPLFVIAIFLGWMTSWVELHVAHAEGSEFHLSFVEKWLVAGRAVWFYLGKIFWPANLIFSYPRWDINPSVWWQWLFPISLAVLFAALWTARGRNRGPLAALLFFAGTLFPTLGFFNVYAFRYSFVADHWQYIACAGPIVLVAASARKYCRVCGPILVAVLAVLTWRQSIIYTDAETVWRATIARNPGSWMAHNDLGSLLMMQGQLDPAIEQFKQAIAIQPGSVNAQDNLGKALLQKGDLESAVEHLRAALSHQPGNAEIHNNLGNALLREGKLNEAMQEIRAALALEPVFPEAYYNLAEILLRNGSPAPALNALAWTFATSPNPRLRNGPEAVRLAARAVALTGTNDPDSIDTLAAACAEQGKFAEAAQSEKTALKLARPKGNPAMISDLENRLRLFQRSQPYREQK